MERVLGHLHAVVKSGCVIVGELDVSVCVPGLEELRDLSNDCWVRELGGSEFKIVDSDVCSDDVEFNSFVESHHADCISELLKIPWPLAESRWSCEADIKSDFGSDLGAQQCSIVATKSFT